MALSTANTSFALNLFKSLGDNDRCTNVFFSPLSISSALAMVLLGARGNTATQMSEVLSFKKAEKPPQAQPMPMQMQMQMTQQHQHLLPPHLRKGVNKDELSDDVHSSFSTLLQEFHKPDAPYALSVANRLYGEETYQFVENFLEETRKYYNAELQTVDFQSKSEEARVTINTWVEQQTQGKIKDVLAKGVVDSLTKLVLVNAIYFKGNWNKQFSESSTRDSQFRINMNETKPVKMMHQKSKFPLTFIGEINCQIIELPYEEKVLSMLIFLPSSIEDGLEKLEQQLTYENFVEWTRPDMMDEVEVQLGLPRFKMEETYDLKNVLTSMGMVDAFDMGRSNFSGMSPGNDLFLSKVVHKAFVEVNEEGTEAAAATAAIMMLRCAPMSPRFIADHPFMFFIRHNTTKTILFAGRYCSPE
uniref:Serpin B6 n=1 Tax=Periophthalmus magnuspinnatus TaxID=409849 RepID=A0A3B3ZNT7_9GOBI